MPARTRAPLKSPRISSASLTSEIFNGESKRNDHMCTIFEIFRQPCQYGHQICSCLELTYVSNLFSQSKTRDQLGSWKLELKAWSVADEMRSLQTAFKPDCKAFCDKASHIRWSHNSQAAIFPDLSACERGCIVVECFIASTYPILGT